MQGITPSTPASRRARGAWIAPLLLALAACGRPEPAGPPPNVVLIVIDTLRADRLGCYGHPRPTSPFIDTLAAQGVLFEDVTAQSSWTLPSMSSLWTGRYITDHVESPAPHWPVLAELFQRAGYHTIGASANPLLSPEAGFARGFDSYRHYPHLEGRAPADRLVADIWEPIDQALSAGGGGRTPPLFLYLQPLDPHTPYRPHERLDRRLPADQALPLAPPGWHAAQLELFGPPPPEDDPDWSRALEAMHVERGVYDQEVAFVDLQIGLLLQGLRARGVLDDAIVVIASDHGECLYDHRTPLPPELERELPPSLFFFTAHGYVLYEPIIRTPLIFWGRGVPQGVRVKEAVENVDIFPTLLHLTGIGPAGPVDGHSLVGLMHGREQAWRELTFSFVQQNTSVHDRRTGYKLVEPTDFGRARGMELALYHLPSDPFEQRNLVAQQPAEVERLQGLLDEWRARHPAPAMERRVRSQEELDLMQALGYLGDEHGLNIIELDTEPSDPKK